MIRYKGPCLLLLLASLLVGTSVAAQKKSPFVKEFNENFNLSANGTVALDNRYGKIEIKTWDQPKVEVRVTVTVKSESRKEAEEVFSHIRILFKQNGDQVSASTMLDNNDSWLGGWNNSRSEFRIDYDVRMPDKATLDLKNRYGDVSIDHHAGKSKIVLSYGSLKTGALEGISEIDLAYGKAICEALRNTDLNMKYSKLDVIRADQLRAQTAYSEIRLNDSEKLQAEGKYDTYRLGTSGDAYIVIAYGDVGIEKAGKLLLKSKFTNTNIDVLNKALKAESTYGNLKIGSLSSRFEEILFSGKYSDLYLVKPDTDFRMEVETTFGGIHLPPSLHEQILEEKAGFKKLKAYNGQASSGRLIGVKLNHGSLRMK
ncbi:MAG: hypothetical protein J5I41_07040 [Saprospiraceae bacterium]|nr:hypothetical protein [Saprospiraceae bacterium]